MSVTPTRLAALAVAWLLLAATAAGAQAPPDEPERDAQLDFLVEPAPGATTAPGGGWFLLDLEPGAETRQELTLHNRADEPVELALAAVDADTGPTGGASYRRLSEPVEATGTWIRLEQDRMALGPGESAIVRFAVAVPEEALSGEHLAGIAVWTPGDIEEVEEVPGAVIAIEQRRVVAVQMALPGPAEPLLRVSAVEPQAYPGGVRLLVHITNEGRGLTHGEGVLQLEELGFDHAFEFGTFVPGTTIAYPVPWTDARPPEGEFQARVLLEYGMWSETWEGTFMIGEDIVGELELFIDEPAIAWWWLAGVAGLLVLTASGWGIRRLGRRLPKPPRQRPRQPATQPRHPPDRRRQQRSWSSPSPK